MGVSGRPKQTDRRTWQLYDWIGLMADAVKITAILINGWILPSISGVASGRVCACKRQLSQQCPATLNIILFITIFCPFLITHFIDISLGNWRKEEEKLDFLKSFIYPFIKKSRLSLAPLEEGHISYYLKVNVLPKLCGHIKGFFFKTRSSDCFKAISLSN